MKPFPVYIIRQRKMSLHSPLHAAAMSFKRLHLVMLQRVAIKWSIVLRGASVDNYGGKWNGGSRMNSACESQRTTQVQQSA